jgi:acetyl esterase
MTLDPGAQKVVDAMRQAAAEGKPSPLMVDPEQGRAIYRATRGPLAPEPQEVALSEDVAIPGPAGDVPSRYYRPKGGDDGAVLPLYIYLHGGGWKLGDLDSHDGVCRAIANAGGFAVLAVDYRLAPEHKYPAAVEDSYAAYQWAVGGAGGRKIDRGRVAVGGDSAGGNLAAVVALMARDEGLALAHQSLIYPSLDFSTDERPSRVALGGEYGPMTHEHRFVRESYLGDPKQAMEWRASPLLADDLTGVAPAFVLTCGYDPLKDEGADYTDKLKSAAVPAVHKRFEGQIHGFLGMGKVIPEAADAIHEIAVHARRAFAM